MRLQKLRITQICVLGETALLDIYFVYKMNNKFVFVEFISSSKMAVVFNG